MGLLNLIGFALQCFDVLAWPLFALVYSLYTSIRAIETNSITDTQKINTYWVVFSLILLFEHAFMKLLEWFLLWPYIRLLIVFFLVMPHFDGALYVYKHLICSCLSMDPQIIINLFNKQKESLVRDNFLSEVERYVKENGPEGLEKFIACKPKGGQNDIKAVQVMVKKKETTGSHVSPAELNLTVNEDKFSSGKMNVKAIEVAADGEILNTPPPKKVQKEWTTVSPLPTQTDATFSSPLGDNRHKATYEGLKIKNEGKPKLTGPENRTVAAIEIYGKPVEVGTGIEDPEHPKEVQKEWTCNFCQETIYEYNLNSHLRGRKHRAAYEALKAGNQAFVPYLSNEWSSYIQHGFEADSLNMLSWYREALFESNAGSTFVLEVDSSSNRFQRLFLAYAGCVEGFEFCLPVLFLDGTFGKNIYKGQILCATGMNGNQSFFPFAMCVCDSETDANWTFFFEHLKSLLEPQGRVITFICARTVGLLSAFDKVFPGNPHLFCYKHLAFNLMSKYKDEGGSVMKEDVKKKFFELAYSCIEKEYHFHLRELTEVGGFDIINAFLSDMSLENWCCAFFLGSRYGIMANSITESFNSWFSLEREMPVYTMLDQTRIKIMQQMSERRDEAELWITELIPVMEGCLKDGIEQARNFSVHYLHTNVYEVHFKYSYEVNLGTLSCSCKKWQINCFPCCHGLAAIQSASLDVYAFIDEYFRVDHYLKCYDFPIRPISNMDILPPLKKRPPRRPKSRGESKKKLIHCGRCGKMGQHNKKTCTVSI